MSEGAIDLSKPRYDQKTYMGRALHFWHLTNPLNILATDAQLDEAKKVVQDYKNSGKIPEGYDADKLWKAKYLYDSAFHPDTGEKLIVIGRMAAQAPMNTLITGGMITFYKTNSATIFWQWLNQTFNAVVNYSNRSGDAPIKPTALAMSYAAACSGALGTALSLNRVVKNNPKINPVFARLVPFAAVCGANFINIPMMRSSEIINGTPLFTEDGKRVGQSSRAAMYGIALVCFSRVIMAVPGMTMVPVLTNMATNAGWFKKKPARATWFQLGLLGFVLVFATPLACAIFEQQASFPVSALEPEVQEQVKKADSKATKVVFNKGL